MVVVEAVEETRESPSVLGRSLHWGRVPPSILEKKHHRRHHHNWRR
jgi:hypothetical protein